MVAPTARIARFGIFELDVRTGELRKRGVRLPLQEQPFKVLVLLLQRAADLVTREELERLLWSDSVFVDFDHGLNKAVLKVRHALGDSAESPRFVETLKGRGYRFIATVEWEDSEPRCSPHPRRRRLLTLQGWRWAAVLLAFLRRSTS